jgi:hypothetical protein
MEQEQEETDTRQFATHSEWCVWLATRSSLAVGHRGCRGAPRCVAYDRHVVRALNDTRR